jgi:hypothetical protein
VSLNLQRSVLTYEGQSRLTKVSLDLRRSVSTYEGRSLGVEVRLEAVRSVSMYTPGENLAGGFQGYL